MCDVTPAIVGRRRISAALVSVSGLLRRHGQLSADPLQELISAGQRVMKNVVGPAAAMLLEEIGKPYDLQPVNLREGAQYKPEFTAVSAKSKVPALQRDEAGVWTVTTPPAAMMRAG